MIKTIITCLLILSAATASPSLAATGHFYSPAAVKGARENVKNFEWAQKEKANLLEATKPWMAMSYDQVWNFLSEQSIPRSLFGAKPSRCPIHGSLESHGDYAWKVATENRWKVQCPIGGETWPTNDFESYYKSGKDANNNFNPGRANSGLLYSKDGSRPYGVDNGTGYVDSSGTRYDFIGYYATWGIWHRVARADYNAITSLTQSYLLTGNAEYGRRAALLLARAADLYQSMDTSYWSARGIVANDGGTNKGKVLGSIWDDEVANNLMMAYDALGSFIVKDKKTQQLLATYAKKYALEPQSTGKAIVSHIEAHLLAPISQAVIDRQIRSNEGRAQYTMALSSLLQGGQALKAGHEWLNTPGENNEGGGHLPNLFWGLVDRDGAGTESSPFYNSLWLDALLPMARVLKLSNPKVNIFREFPHISALLHFPGRLMNLGKYYPHIGDSGAFANPEFPLPGLVKRYVEAFLWFGDEKAAVRAFELNGEKADDLHAGLFDGDYSKIVPKIKQLVNSSGRDWERSDNMNGYGLAMHRAGQSSQARTMWMYWGRTGHNGDHPHADRLNLGLFAYGLDLLPDLGYPEYTIAWPTTQGWIKNTASHNTVVVDGQRQAQSFSGDQRVFADTPHVQFTEADGGDVYPQTSLYRRSAAMIQIDDNRSYVIDLFRIRGGSEHVYSFHAAEGQVTTSGLNLTAQPGTFAGPGVAKGTFYDQAFSGTYSGSGFQFLNNVSTDAAAGAQFTADWKVNDTHGVLPPELTDQVHLRLTMLGNEGQVTMADGQPSQTNGANPESIRYMLVKNSGQDVQSRFLGVIEPYVKNPAVKSVALLPVDGTADKNVIALKVVLTTGRVDYIFSALDDVTHTTADGRFTFRGTYSVYAEKGGEMAFSFLADGGELKVDGNVVATGQTPYGKIVAVDKNDEGSAVVTVDQLIPDDGSFTNRWVDFGSSVASDANFKVAGVKTAGATSQLTLSPVDIHAGFTNPNDYAGELAPIISAGNAFRFPGTVFAKGAAYEELTLGFEGDGGSLKKQAKSDSEESAPGCAQSGTESTLWSLLAALGLMLLRKRAGVRLQ